MIWNIPTPIWKAFSSHWQVLSKDAKNPEEGNTTICRLEVKLEWQTESTIDYMCNSCGEGRLKVGEDGKTFKWEGNFCLGEMGKLNKSNVTPLS